MKPLRAVSGIKPRIYLRYGFWLCVGRMLGGAGSTPYYAYRNWASQL